MFGNGTQGPQGDRLSRDALSSSHTTSCHQNPHNAASSSRIKNRVTQSGAASLWGALFADLRNTASPRTACQPTSGRPGPARPRADSSPWLLPEWQLQRPTCNAPVSFPFAGAQQGRTGCSSQQPTEGWSVEVKVGGGPAHTGPSPLHFKSGLRLSDFRFPVRGGPWLARGTEQRDPTGGSPQGPHSSRKTKLMNVCTYCHASRSAENAQESGP